MAIFTAGDLLDLRTVPRPVHQAVPRGARWQEDQAAGVLPRQVGQGPDGRPEWAQKETGSCWTCWLKFALVFRQSPKSTHRCSRAASDPRCRCGASRDCTCPTWWWRWTAAPCATWTASRGWRASSTSATPPANTKSSRWKRPPHASTRSSSSRPTCASIPISGNEPSTVPSSLVFFILRRRGPLFFGQAQRDGREQDPVLAGRGLAPQTGLARRNGGRESFVQTAEPARKLFASSSKTKQKE